jgi:hypothetical protein
MPKLRSYSNQHTDHYKKRQHTARHMQRPFINHIDTRRGCLFTQHVFKQDTQLQHPAPSLNQLKEFTKHYILREVVADVDSHEPVNQPQTSNIILEQYEKLRESCSKFDLNVVRQGRFFMVVNTAKQRLLQGFIIPQTNRFCVFFQGPSSDQTVQCPSATHAETYVKSFFSIEDDETDEMPTPKNADV